MLRFSFRTLLAVVPATLALFQTTSAQPTKVYALTGGQWFDGDGFTARTVYIVEDRVSFTLPGRVDTTVQLNGGYVVPAFGEAHNHNLTASAGQIDFYVPRYLHHGVFYARMQSSMPLITGTLLHRLNSPTSVDVAFANAPITASGGHPVAIRERLLARGIYPGFTKETLDGQGYVIVDDAEQLDRKWASILSYRPDFLKVILLHSEEFAKRKDDPGFFGQKGFDPALLPVLVSKAHAHGLQVSAHVSSGEDFRRAVEAGVDQIAHLPGMQDSTSIREADAKLAAERDIVVVTTTVLARRLAGQPERYEAIRAAQRRNLQLLHRHGVTLAIGSDEPEDTSISEIRYLRELGVFDNLTLLRMWATNAPRAIFPGRRIGHLRQGYEANFLVLEGNPLEDFDNVTKIRTRFKQGRPLVVPQPPDSTRTAGGGGDRR
jgi:imidazolonepropionase-like amidohydrolase